MAYLMYSGIAPLCAPQDLIYIYVRIPLHFDLHSCPITFTEAQCISKEDMCDSLRSLAGCNSSDNCTINSDCTCVSFTFVISGIKISLTIYIVDPCAKPVCFNISSESDFSEIVCNTTTIPFTTLRTFRHPFLPKLITLPVCASITVELVLIMPPTKILMTVSCLLNSIADIFILCICLLQFLAFSYSSHTKYLMIIDICM